MSTREIVLEEDPRYYPFLLDYAFDRRDGTFNPRNFWILVGKYIEQHIRKDLEKKGGNAKEVLESFIKKLVDEYSGKDSSNAVSTFLGDVGKLESGEEVRFPISMTNVTLRLKRFGECLGIRATDGRDSVHESATEIIKGIVLCGYPFTRFIHRRSITMPRWQAYGNNIDVLSELASVARYVPDVEWRTDADVVADALFENYIETNHAHNFYSGEGVEVGRYHGIPVHIEVLFGDKSHDRTWRKGSVSRVHGKPVLEFGENHQAGDLTLKYLIQITDDDNMFKPAVKGIDYMREQQCHNQLAKILMDAFSARDLAETVSRNPSHVVWKEPTKVLQEEAAN